MEKGKIGPLTGLAVLLLVSVAIVSSGWGVNEGSIKSKNPDYSTYDTTYTGISTFE